MNEAKQRFKWTEEAIDELRRRTKSGESFHDIARHIGCEARTARRMQFQLNLSTRAYARADWTRHEKAIIRRRYPHEKTERIAADLPGRTTEAVYRCAMKMGLRKTEKYLASADACRLRRGDHVGKAFWYGKGHEPANKGTRRPGWGPGRMKETQFKKGNRTGAANLNWKPVGTISPDFEGFLRIKVREPYLGEKPTGFGNQKIWPLLNRHVWEQHNGPIPASHNIAFKDGDRKNCDIANLECISRAEQMHRNRIHGRYPKEMVNTIMLLGAVKRKLREKYEERNNRSAQPSV